MEKIEYLGMINNNSDLKNKKVFYDGQSNERLDFLTDDVYVSWNTIKADIVRNFEPALRKYFDAKTTSRYTSGIYFYSNTTTNITENVELPPRSLKNGYADFVINSINTGDRINVSIFSSVRDNKINISNDCRISGLYNLDYALVPLSENTIVLVNTKKARLTMDKFEKTIGHNAMKDVSFEKYSYKLVDLPKDCVDILSYDRSVKEYYLNQSLYEIEKEYNYRQIPNYVEVENMPRTKTVYTIVNFKNNNVYRCTLKEFSRSVSSALLKYKSIKIHEDIIYCRFRNQMKKQSGSGYFELYLKETGNYYIVTKLMNDEEIKSFQEIVNNHTCKPHGESKYVKKVDRPKKQLQTLIKTTRNIKAEDTLTDADLDEMGLFALDHKNTKFLSNSIKATTEFIYGGVCKDEVTKERNNKKFLPAFFTFEADNLSLEQQMKYLDKALVSEYKDSVFFATHSGNKSIHITVWIEPCYREIVSKNYKECWRQTALKVFGTFEPFDEQCASIAHPARIPNGIRYREDTNEYVLQECLYLNKSPVGMRCETERPIVEQYNKKYTRDDKTIDDLTRMYKCKPTEALQVAYDVVVLNKLESGAGYINGLASLIRRGFSDNFIKTNYYDKVMSTHPTALGYRSFENYRALFKR